MDMSHLNHGEGKKIPQPKEKKTRSQIGKRNKQKGNQAERDLAKLFRELGFPFACTTRLNSKLLDSCGIDVDNVPVIIQSKAGEYKSLKLRDELKYIKERVLLKIHPESPQGEWHHKPKIVVHTMPCEGNKRTEFDTLATLTLDDLVKLIKLAYNNEIIKNTNTDGTGNKPVDRREEESLGEDSGNH